MAELNPKDLRIETFWAPDKDAWSMKPDRVVRITHVPSGISVTEGSEFNQHRNRAEAFRKLQLVADFMPELFVEPTLPSPQDIMRFHEDMLQLVRDGQRYRKLKDILKTGKAAEISMNMAELYEGRSDPGSQVMIRVYTGMYDTIQTHRGPTLDIVIDMAPLPNPNPKPTES